MTFMAFLQSPCRGSGGSRGRSYRWLDLALELSGLLSLDPFPPPQPSEPIEDQIG